MPARKSDSGDDGIFFLKVITCFPGNRYLETKSIRINCRSTAYAQCDAIQSALDQDGDPARAYVFDVDGIAIRAGLTAYARASYFFAALRRKPHEAGRAHNPAGGVPGIHNKERLAVQTPGSERPGHGKRQDAA